MKKSDIKVNEKEMVEEVNEKEMVEEVNEKEIVEEEWNFETPESVLHSSDVRIQELNDVFKTSVETLYDDVPDFSEEAISKESLLNATKKDLDLLLNDKRISLNTHAYLINKLNEKEILDSKLSSDIRAIKMTDSKQKLDDGIKKIVGASKGTSGKIKSNKKKIIIISSVIVGLAMIISGVIFAYGYYDDNLKVLSDDLSKTLVAKQSGIDGNGELSLFVKDVESKEATVGDTTDKESDETFVDGTEITNANLLSYLESKTEDYGSSEKNRRFTNVQDTAVINYNEAIDLSNGDVGKIIIKFDDELMRENHVNIINSTFEVQVEGLLVMADKVKLVEQNAAASLDAAVQDKSLDSTFTEVNKLDTNIYELNDVYSAASDTKSVLVVTDYISYYGNTPHLLTYGEAFSMNGEQIKDFTVNTNEYCLSSVGSFSSNSIESVMENCTMTKEYLTNKGFIVDLREDSTQEMIDAINAVSLRNIDIKDRKYKYSDTVYKFEKAKTIENFLNNNTTLYNVTSIQENEYQDGALEESTTHYCFQNYPVVIRTSENVYYFQQYNEITSSYDCSESSSSETYEDIKKSLFSSNDANTAITIKKAAN